MPKRYAVAPATSLSLTFPGWAEIWLSVSHWRTRCRARRISSDVVKAVQFAGSQGMRIAPQSTGHGAVPLEPLQDVVLLETSRMRRVDIYRTARAEAGAQWQDVTVPAGEHGLAALAGTAPNVGVTGYTLGGGLGWLARRYGLAANSVTAVEIVTPAAASRAPTPTTSRTCSGPSEAAAAASGS